MPDMFAKLLMAREIKFKEGEISLLGDRVVLIPAYSLGSMLKSASENPELGKSLYYVSKECLRNGFAKVVRSKYGLTGMRLIEWLVNVGHVAGWGSISIVKRDVSPERVEFVFHVKNPPLLGLAKSAKPVDHIFRGMIAGGESMAFDADVEAIETKCVAQGNPYCEFVAKRREQFLADKNNPLVAEQLKLD
jgi:predicted hydrocarbon binding protein